MFLLNDQVVNTKVSWLITDLRIEIVWLNYQTLNTKSTLVNN